MQSNQCATNHAAAICPDLTASQGPIPGGVYLCQVGERVSCGACCGLYNVADDSREALEKLLRRRTLRFAETPRSAEGIDHFVQWTTVSDPDRRPFADFHHCPFLGLIGTANERVGCLLHPAADGNEGVDYRGMSYYGALACRTYFCPSTHHLPPRWKQILRRLFDDWYLFGQVITEKDLISACFRIIEDAVGRPLEPDLPWELPDVRVPFKALLGLKIDWPYRPA